MARRAQQGSVAHCPYCEASLPQVAAECPQCRFPLTMAAAEVGFRAPEPSGTTSTATPGGRTTPPVLPGHTLHRPRIHGSREHRIRMTAWMLGVTAVLLVLAGVGAILSASSPGAASAREATNALLISQRRVAEPEHRNDVAITPLVEAQESSRPSEVSVDKGSGIWFGAVRASGGTCHVMAVRLNDGVKLVNGTLDKGEPCSGAHLRSRYEERQARQEQSRR